MKFNVVYEDLLTFDEQSSESDPGLKISGVAFKVGKIASKRIIIPSDAKNAITETLRDSPILTDHNARILNLVGRVDESWSEGDLVKFKGTILDSVVEDKIRKKLISKVSIGLHVDARARAEA